MSGVIGEEIRKPKYPKFRVGSCRSYFVIRERVVRGFRFEYRTCEVWGRFETRDAAQAFLDTRKEAA